MVAAASAAAAGCAASKGYESLSKIWLSAKEHNAIGLLLAKLCDKNAANVTAAAAAAAEGYESLSEIRLSAKKHNAMRLLLADTRLREEEEDLTSSFITRVQDISGQLPSNR